MNHVNPCYVNLIYKFLEGDKKNPKDIIGRPPYGKAKVSILKWKKILNCLENEYGNREGLGIDIAKEFEISHYGVLGYLLANCKNMKEVFVLSMKYSSLISNNNPVSISIDKDRLEISIPQVHGRVSQLSDEIGLGTILVLLRKLTNECINVKTINFMGEKPKNFKKYIDFFGDNIFFEKKEPSLVLDTECLFFEIKYPIENSLKQLDELASQYLQEVSPLPISLIKYRLQLIEILRTEGEINLNKLARRNNLTPRTLQRKFKVYNMTFRALLDRTRCELAEQYLENPLFALSDVSYLLGFSEQSAFNRAFFQWKGQTPVEWRADHVLNV